MYQLVLTLGLVITLNSPVFAQSSRVERVLSADEVRVCIWPDYYGISFRDPKTQQLRGIDIDIAMFAIGITPLRSEKLRFTRPHLMSDVYAITTKSNRRIKTWEDIDQPGVVVAVAKGTLHEGVMREKLKHATLLVTATTQGREQEVEAGRADVFMTDFPFSRRMLETTDWARLVMPTTTYHLTPYAYAMQKGDDAWLARIERFMSEAKRNGQLLATVKRHKLDPIAVTE